MINAKAQITNDKLNPNYLMSKNESLNILI